MHDIGKLLMISVGEELYGRLDEDELKRPNHLHKLELVRLGYDHAMLSGQVLSLWSFPDPVPQVVSWHHVPKLAYRHAAIAKRVAMLRAADILEHALAKVDDQSSLASREPDPDDAAAVKENKDQTTMAFMSELCKNMKEDTEQDTSEPREGEEPVDLDRVFESMCGSVDFELAGITRDYLENKWETLADIREESLSVFY